jgi:hypothetical protein
MGDFLGGGGGYMAIRGARFHGHSERFRLADVLQIATLFALLGGVLLKHAWPQLPGHHLVAAAALPFALCGLDHVLVPRHLLRTRGLGGGGGILFCKEYRGVVEPLLEE